MGRQRSGVYLWRSTWERSARLSLRATCLRRARGTDVIEPYKSTDDADLLRPAQSYGPPPHHELFGRASGRCASCGKDERFPVAWPHCGYHDKTEDFIQEVILLTLRRERPIDAECDRCGRLCALADCWAASRAQWALALGDLYPRLRQFYIAADTREPWSIANLQRHLGMSYEEAASCLGRATDLGLLKKPREHVLVQLGPYCPECYGQLADKAALKSARQPTSGGHNRQAIPPQLRFRVLQRDAFRCFYCGRTARDGAQLHLDHVVPVSAGGATSEDNLLTACDACNLGKSSTDIVGG